MENCKQRCNDIQIKINNKQREINKVDHKPGTYSTDELKQYNKLHDEFDNLTLDLQRCIDECKLRNRHRDVDDYSNDGKHVGVDPVIFLQELKALKAIEALEKEEEEYSGGRTRSTFRRRNKSKTKRRQTRSTRRRNTRRRRSTRRNRKQ
jgi:hypothetical protein